jgi:hypothetical protein
VNIGVWGAVSARRMLDLGFLKKQLIAKDMERSFSGNPFQSYNKRMKDSMAGVSKTQLLPTLHVYLCRPCPMSSKLELAAVVFD